MEKTKGNDFDATQIHERMPVVCSENVQFGTVDRVEGQSIKLTKDREGQHHWIPVGWVTHVDDKVHIDRPGSQAAAVDAVTAARRLTEAKHD